MVSDDWIDAARGNDIPWKWLFVGPIGVTGKRIIELISGCDDTVRIISSREHVTAQHRRRGNGNKAAISLAREVSFVAAEIEQLVANNRTGDRYACIIVDKMGRLLSSRLEKVACHTQGIDVVCVGRSVKCIRPAFESYGYGRTAGKTLFGVGAVGHYVNALNRFR